MMGHVHKFYMANDGPDCECCKYEAMIAIAECGCGEKLGPTVIELRLNTTEWLMRMGNEDIAAELSATFDLNLEDTRKIADWILEGK